MAYGDYKHPVKYADLTSLTYVDSSGQEHPYPICGQGRHSTVMKSDGTIVDQAEYERDEFGLTNPTLHRRVDPQEPPAPEDPNYDPTDPTSVNRAYLNKEIAPRDYDITLQGVNSYRTTTHTVHDEESTTVEIP